MERFKLIVEYRDGPSYDDLLDQISRMTMIFQYGDKEKIYDVVSIPHEALPYTSILDYILMRMIDGLKKNLKENME